MRRIGVVAAIFGTIATLLLGAPAGPLYPDERVVFGFDGPAGEQGVPDLPPSSATTESLVKSVF
jgi:hypothetical protein